MSLKTAVVIPARYASTRFPGKPLVEIEGTSMIQRVYQQASQCSEVNEVIVATDDERIFNHVKGFGGQVQMTAATHQSGTDRCAEVANGLDVDLLVNVQGDEPFIDPEQIKQLIGLFQRADCQIGTLVAQVTTLQELQDPNRVRVVRDVNDKALYFTRSTIPYLRNAPHDNWHLERPYYKHVGIYAYRKNVLQQIAQLPASGLEIAEGLEQLRWLENGYSIYTALTSSESPCIDTPQDLELLKDWLQKRG